MLKKWESSKMPSHAEKLKSEQGIYILRSSTESGISVYFYFRPHFGKDALFRRDFKRKAHLSLVEYGEILESGMGATPTAESILRMQHDYDFVTPDL